MNGQDKKTEMSGEVELTVLAPMYNEARNVENTVSMIRNTLDRFDKRWELLLVNDGSDDETLTIARDLESKMENLRVISYPKNCGRGKALRTGFENAWGKYVVTIDFDLSYDPSHILKIYDELVDEQQMNDVVLGSAYMDGGRVDGVNPRRLIVSKIGNKILEYTFPQSFKTSTCILRGYKKEVLDALELDSDGKEIHLDILSKVCATGYRVKEIPATLSGRRMGKSKFDFGRTSARHLVFSLFERPVLLFGAVGLSLILAGLVIGLYIAWLRYFGDLNPSRPLVPLMIIILIMGGQFFCFAFVACQNIHLRNELYKLQKQINLSKKE
jgi:glycosyltransferase involved in cell wall biosynthesis